MPLSMPGTSDGSSDTIFIPRPHQLAARDAILAAKREGRPGFLLGDLTGLGKTLSVWAALAAMPEHDILIVCPKGGMPQWRRTMALSGLPAKRVILNQLRARPDHRAGRRPGRTHARPR